MSVLNKHISINKEVATLDDLDFNFLKKKGLEHIEELGGSIWTDYNSHDPGITILEMLCYAITDLGMRINLPIENLLSSQDSLKNINQQFYKASEILPTKPVTSLDYRKLFIDIDGVKNCWPRKYTKTVYVDCNNNLLSYKKEDFNDIPESKKKNFNLKGLYHLVVDFESDDPSEIASVIKKIKKQYHANRNLCEDLISIEKVKTQPISVCADIEVETTADEEYIHAQILNEINNYFVTNVHFYSIKQMLEKGYVSTEIFDGPILNNGFIDPEELINSELKNQVRLSDIINIIMDIPGVKVIKDISMGNCDSENIAQSIICIDDDTKPLLCSKSVINYNKDVLPLSLNQNKVAEYLAEFEAIEEAEKENASQNKELDIPQGIYSEPGSYTTMQNDFPDTYGISNSGLSGNPTIQRKSQAKQLKGFLLFFDQILASYFKHLEKMNEILAVNGELTKTFFTQSVQDIEGFSELIKDYDTSNNDALTEELFEKLDNNIERRNEVLDHLIARFAERFTEYTFVMKSLYGTSADEIVLRNKENFLKDYKEISSARGNAFNYYKQSPSNLWNTNNVSGVQKRIARLLGVSDYSRRNLTNSFVEIYTLTNSDGCEVYRWRIRNLENKIILSATDEYHDNYLATRELYFAVLQIIQTSSYQVEKAFEDGISSDSVIDNFRIHQSPSGRYSFDIINPEIEDENDSDYIIAKRFTYFDTQEEIKEAILSIIDFMKYDFTEEGIFLVEHMLLRPDVTKLEANTNQFMPICADECTNCEPLDPYSYRVSIIIPGYTFRFYNTDFRNYMEKIIRQEIPAHVLAKICWVGYRKNEVENDENDLLKFEKAYKKYLLKKTHLEQEQPEPELQNIIESITSVSNVYPTGRLFDCDDEVEELSGKVILGKTNLGSL